MNSDFLGAPAAPIASVAGHQPGCYDACGNYRSCEPGCPASARWARDAALREHLLTEHTQAVRKWGDDGPPASEKEA
jgi:hypothetical protein